MAAAEAAEQAAVAARAAPEKADDSVDTPANYRLRCAQQAAEDAEALARQAVKFQEKTGKPAASALREESQRGHNMPYCRSHEKRAREVSWSSPSLILSSISFSSIISSHFVLPSQPACGKDE